jgi:hypothetical protein
MPSSPPALVAPPALKILVVAVTVNGVASADIDSTVSASTRLRNSVVFFIRFSSKKKQLTPMD